MREVGGGGDFLHLPHYLFGGSQRTVISLKAKWKEAQNSSGQNSTTMAIHDRGNVIPLPDQGPAGWGGKEGGVPPNKIHRSLAESEPTGNIFF